MRLRRPLSPRWWLIVFVILGFALRLGFLLSDPHPDVNAGLAAESGEVARNLVAGHGFVLNRRTTERPPPGIASISELALVQHSARHLVDPSEVNFSAVDRHPRYQPMALEMPGDALVLAGAWWITGDDSYIYLQVLQILIDSAMAVVVYWIALRLFERRRAALIAAGLYALFPPIAWLMKIPHVDALAVDATIGVTALMLRATAEPARLRWGILAGLVTGIGLYFRPTVFLVPLAIGAAAIPWMGWRRSIRLVSVPLAVAVLVLAPWTLRNAHVFGKFVPTRVGIGQNLWEGMGEIHNSYGPVLNDAQAAMFVSVRRPDLQYGTPAFDSYLQSQALKVISAHPAFFARVVARRILHATLLLRNTEWGGSAIPANHSKLRWALTHPFWALAQVLEPLIFLIAVLTAVLSARRYLRQHLFLFAIFLGTVVPYLILHLESRYVLPASFIYLCLVGLGADLLLERVQVRVRKRPALAAA